MIDLNSGLAIQATQAQAIQSLEGSGVDTMIAAIAGPGSTVKSRAESTGYWERFNQYRSRMRELGIKRAFSRKA
jgi:hypothetical protein